MDLPRVAVFVGAGSGGQGVGALAGRLLASGVVAAWPAIAIDPKVYAVVGMSALSASVIGGPLTMTFIAIETTGDLWLTTAVLIAVIVSTQVTRELFGYSFATCASTCAAKPYAAQPTSDGSRSHR